MANINYDPNAAYDNGPAAAGSERVSAQATLTGDATTGLQSDNALAHANSRCGFSCAGNQRNNPGPHVAGAPRSYADTQ